MEDTATSSEQKSKTTVVFKSHFIFLMLWYFPVSKNRVHQIEFGRLETSES